MTSVLVTGGAGFIGSHVAEAYLAAGHEVTVLDNLSSGRIENVPRGARFVRADVEGDEARKLLERGGFPVLNHHAAQVDVRVSVTDPQLDARINLLGLLNLLEGARRGGVQRVVFASSGGVVYGEAQEPPHTETAPKLPVSPYGVTKLASEHYLTAYAQLYGLEVVSLRYSNVYGPRQNPHGEAGVVAIFAERVGRGRALTVYGDGAQTRDYVYVGDVSRANVAATTWRVPAIDSIDAVAFNIATQSETSVNTLARMMIDAAGASVPVEHAPARTGELLRNALRIDKAARELGWRPSMSLAEGLKRTYQWIREAAA
jgi:UDP-glucose 4-epimerase